jgi:hypothetical protein
MLLSQYTCVYYCMCMYMLLTVFDRYYCGVGAGDVEPIFRPGLCNMQYIMEFHTHRRLDDEMII